MFLAMNCVARKKRIPTMIKKKRTIPGYIKSRGLTPEIDARIFFVSWDMVVYCVERAMIVALKDIAAVPYQPSLPEEIFIESILVK